jgi:hypothetical protein
MGVLSKGLANLRWAIAASLACWAVFLVWADLNIHGGSWSFVVGGVAAAAVAMVGGLFGVVEMISIPLMVELSVTVVSLITICPDVFAVAVNSFTTALYLSPAEALQVRVSEVPRLVAPFAGIKGQKPEAPAAVTTLAGEVPGSGKPRATLTVSEASGPPVMTRLDIWWIFTQSLPTLS